MHKLGLVLAAVFVLAGCCSESKGDCKEIEILEHEITIDGQTDDWSGIPVGIQDPRGENVSTNGGTEIKEIYLARQGNGLCFLLKLHGDANTDSKWIYQIEMKYDIGDEDIPQNHNCHVYYDSGQSDWNSECDNQQQGYEMLEVNGSSIELEVDLSGKWNSPPELLQVKSFVADTLCSDCAQHETLCVWSRL